MNTVIVVLVTICLVGANAQLPTAAPTQHTQQAQNPQHIMQEFFLYRLLFGDAAANILIAERMARAMGGGLVGRMYTGEMLDTPDAWWLTSSLLRNQQAAGQTGTGSGTGTGAGTGTGTGTTLG